MSENTILVGESETLSDPPNNLIVLAEHRLSRATALATEPDRDHLSLMMQASTNVPAEVPPPDDFARRVCSAVAAEAERLPVVLAAFVAADGLRWTMQGNEEDFDAYVACGAAEGRIERLLARRGSRIEGGYDHGGVNPPIGWTVAFYRR